MIRQAIILLQLLIAFTLSVPSVPSPESHPVVHGPRFVGMIPSCGSVILMTNHSTLCNNGTHWIVLLEGTSAGRPELNVSWKAIRLKWTVYYGYPIYLPGYWAVTLRGDDIQVNEEVFIVKCRRRAIGNLSAPTWECRREKVRESFMIPRILVKSPEGLLP